ncbi:MAG: BLUF domain-containing protein [Alphaproteobacteria bacterium]|nr:BLUF domain-containing protein [Alphaproteobacteria bacterium]MBU1527089.1 BLUF domain-containing protein [Alphaproteobacteria bacterium]MBU2118382.1 BLUF domain-containing protein [Alphaproteobacteria bacterium]MBU2350715.1 BLUF domain-containing protein [Alphaproteobacteria bacterium]MBU2383435.1 BLUF domain-containing protein [Alphaproteobacteria bacterium]
MALERLIYESRATGSTGSLGNLAVILAESQRNNAHRGLTGALAAHRDRYIQVVEGQPEALDGLLRRLENDPRHRDIRLVHREPVEERVFADWSMASARVTPELAESLDALMAEPAPSPSWIIMALHEAVAGAAH